MLYLCSIVLGYQYHLHTRTRAFKGPLSGTTQHSRIKHLVGPTHERIVLTG